MKPIFRKSQITRTTCEKGQSLEEKLREMTRNNEPIDTKAITPIFTEKEEGVEPQYDIRTDRFEIAINTTDLISRQTAAMRENKPTQLNQQHEEGA